MSELIEINFNDERDEGLKKFSNLVDQIAIETLIQRLKDSNEKRSLQELVEAWLEGN